MHDTFARDERLAKSTRQADYQSSTMFGIDKWEQISPLKLPRHYTDFGRPVYKVRTHYAASGVHLQWTKLLYRCSVSRHGDRELESAGIPVVRTNIWLPDFAFISISGLGSFDLIPPTSSSSNRYNIVFHY